MAGAWITIMGATITLIINYFFIPRYGYMACAWATFACYGSMMVVSFTWGQKYFHVPYAWKKLVSYIVIVVLLYFIDRLFVKMELNVWIERGFAVLLIGLFCLFILNVERKEFQRLPVIGKYLRKL
jgi:O-antigen/teichoic acid export membrane protein